MASVSRIFTFSVLIAAVAIISAATIMSPQEQQAKAQGRENLLQGLITAASGGKPFGGERIGSYAIEPRGNEGNWAMNVLLVVEKAPPAGKVYRAWVEDTKTGTYLNLGQVGTDGKLSFTTTIGTANPYNFNQILLSEESPTTAFQAKPSQVIGGDALPGHPA